MQLKSYWQFKCFNEDKAQQLQQELNISPLVARLLVQRGIDTTIRARSFLYGKLKDLSSPYCLGGMQAAVARIKQAIEGEEKIVIYGDYDVDGICSIVLLKDCFDRLGYPVDYYVPGRFSEGYGLNLEAVEKLAALGYSLVISVDCGIKSIQEADTAAQMDLDIVITDHHTPGDKLPEVAAIINPRIDGNEKNQDLAGVGVAFKLAQALCQEGTTNIDFYQWLDLVALATIADIVPLTGDNRIFVKYGLKKLAQTDRVGLQALIAECGLQDKSLLPAQVGFALAPRLNSAGRLQNAGISIELLLTRDPHLAIEQAKLLSEMNAERRAIEDKIFQEAIATIDSEQMDQDRVLVLGGEGWHQGVIGIVASRLCDRYHRPTILISWDGKIGKGSGRSIPGFDLYQALEYCKSYLLQFGGHKLAAGLTMNKKDAADFRKGINEWCENHYRSEQLGRRQYIDLEVELDDINLSLLNELQSFQPCGEGNPMPVLALRNTPIYSAGLVGQGHFRGQIGRKRLAAIAFNRADLANYPINTCYHDQCFELVQNEFRGQKSLQLKLKDMKPSYQPDNSSTQSFSSALVRVVEKCLEEINDNRPVILVSPTYRILIRQLQVFQSFFRPDLIAELHGRLPARQRKKFELDFGQGSPKIYLMTLSYLRFLLENYDCPARLRLLIQAWPDTMEQNMHCCLRNCEIETMDGKLKNMEWKRVDQAWAYPGKTLIYANRPKTIKHISEQIPTIKIDAGLSSLNQRRKVRQEFWQTQNSALLTDGAYSGCNTFEDKFDQALFADAPFSIFEARLVLEQLQEGSVSAGALFSQQDIRLNCNYLNRIYPERDMVESVWEGLQAFGKGLIYMEIAELVSKLNRSMGKDYSTLELLGVLYVLVDLGLCQMDKKGSIIEIKLKNTENKQLQVSKSPYYLEGKQEKQALVNFTDGIKIFLG
ncbi:MAG: single-stranded-DNA-specific exonuclease RecJ [Syntrophomonadaceae bacterium]|nr:single-stranded-DNA-specific exonuclease RecJ [Syntrophomonadaceae bacterium]